MPRRGLHGIANAFTHLQDIALCGMVGAHPSLYDTSHPNYKDSYDRDNIWRKISLRLRKPEIICKSRWRNIRDSYKRGLRMKKAAGNDHMMRKWVLFEHLHFLENVVGASLPHNDHSKPTKQTEKTNKKSESTSTPKKVVPSSPSTFTVTTRRRSPCVQSLEEVDVTAEDGENGQSERLEIKMEVEDKQDIMNQLEEEFELEDHLLYSLGNEAEQMNHIDGNCNGKPDIATDDFPGLLCNVPGSGESVRKRRERAMVGSGDQSYPQVERSLLRERLTQNWYPYPSRNECEVMEDDTDVFFRSMSMTTKTFIPALLAEAKKKICTLVMDLQMENEKAKAEARSKVESVDAVFTSSSSSRSSSPHPSTAS